MYDINEEIINRSMIYNYRKNNDKNMEFSEREFKVLHLVGLSDLLIFIYNIFF